MNNKKYTIEKIHKISHFSKNSGGFCARATVLPYEAKCIIERIGYKLRFPVYINDDGELDTVLHGWYCERDIKCRDFLLLFSGLDVVSDRDKLRRVVEASATPGGCVTEDLEARANEVASGYCRAKRKVGYLIAEGEQRMSGDISIRVGGAR